jgi:hypothetical protein
MKIFLGIIAGLFLVLAVLTVITPKEFKGIVDGQRLDTEIRFKKPFEGRFNSYVTTESVNEDQTKVVLGMSDTMQFPMTVISFIVNVCLGNQKKIQKNMDDSLSNLKVLLEK